MSRLARAVLALLRRIAIHPFDWSEWIDSCHADAGEES